MLIPPTCPPCTPIRASQSGARALHSCVPVAATLGRCGQGGVLTLPGSEEQPAPPPKRWAAECEPERAAPNPGPQWPEAQQDSESRSRQEAAMGRTRREPLPLTESAKEGSPQSARQTEDCLGGARKAISCLGQGRGSEMGEGGPYNPIANTLHTSTGYSLRAFGINFLGVQGEQEGERD